LLTPVLASHHIDVERNVVAIGVTGVSPELVAEAQKQFGGDVEFFVRKRGKALSRIDSSVDVSAGARLRIRLGGRGIDGKPNTVRASCTSGFAVRSISDHSLHGVLTAGHCFIFIHSEWPGDVADGNNRFIGAGAAWQGKYSQSSTAPFTVIVVRNSVLTSRVRCKTASRVVSAQSLPVNHLQISTILSKRPSSAMAVFALTSAYKSPLRN